MDIEEHFAIEDYKEYFKKHLPNIEYVDELWASNFDKDAYLDLDLISALRKYLDELEPYTRVLLRAAWLRQKHFENFIENKKEEDDGHKAFRIGLNDVAEDAAKKYKYWKLIHDHELEHLIKDYELMKSKEQKEISDNIYVKNVDFDPSLKESKSIVRRPPISRKEKSARKKMRKKFMAQKRREEERLIKEETQKHKKSYAIEDHSAILSSSYKVQIIPGNKLLEWCKKYNLGKPFQSEVLRKGVKIFSSPNIEIISNTNISTASYLNQFMVCLLNGAFEIVKFETLSDNYDDYRSKFMEKLKLTEAEIENIRETIFFTLYYSFKATGGYTNLGALVYFLHQNIDYLTKYSNSEYLFRIIAIFIGNIYCESFIEILPYDSDLLKKLDERNGENKHDLVLDYMIALYPVSRYYESIRLLTSLVDHGEKEEALLYYRKNAYLTRYIKSNDSCILKLNKMRLLENSYLFPDSETIRKIWYDSYNEFLKLVKN